MFTKAENIKTTTYYYDDYIIDIVETSDEFNAFITKDGYGIKCHMFGVCKYQTNKREYEYQSFLNLVKSNIEDEIEYFHQEYEH